MARIARIVAAAVLVFAGALRAEDGSLLQRLQTEIQELGAKARPALARVTVDSPFELSLPEDMRRKMEGRFGAGFPRQSSAVGTGFLVSADGLVLTTSRIVAGATRVRVSIGRGPETEAVVVGADPFFDLAVLRVPPPERAEPLALSTQAPVPGSLGVFTGNSYGFAANLSLGIVAGVRHAPALGAYDNYLVMNAPLLPGDAGGPYLAPDGTVIGMGVDSTTAGTFRIMRQAPEGGFSVGVFGGAGGMGLVVPAEDLRYAMDEIVRRGRVRQGLLGLHIQAGMLEVGAVLSGMPGEAAGVQAGDEIVTFGGVPVESDVDLRFVLRRTRVGEPAPIVVRRGGADVTLSVTPEELSPGFAALLPLLSTLDDGRIQVGNASPRWISAGVFPGDFCVAVNGVKIASLAEAQGALGEAETVVLTLRRGDEYLEVRMPR